MKNPFDIFCDWLEARYPFQKHARKALIVYMIACSGIWVIPFGLYMAAREGAYLDILGVILIYSHAVLFPAIADWFSNRGFTVPDMD